MRYSELEQINRDNVARLKPVWNLQHGRAQRARRQNDRMHAIVIDGVMYVTTGYLRVVALDAATGKEFWQFDPLKDHPFPHAPMPAESTRLRYWSDRRTQRPTTDRTRRG